MEAESPDAIPAPYGQACEECARSKTKCMLSRQGGGCQRCRRLERDCRPAPARRRRRQSTRNPSLGTKSRWMSIEQADRTGRLEEKLQEVMTLLKSGASVATTDSASSSPQTNLEGPPSVESITRPSPSSSTNAGISLSSDDAEEYLAAFVTRRLQYFPICNIPSGMTSHQLRAQHPFLWFSVMTVSATSMSQQRQLATIFKDYLSQLLLRRSERSLDLLQGLLVMLAWNNSSTDITTKIPLSVLSQIAVAVLYDLGLNKQPRSATQHSLCSAPAKPVEESRHRTMEQRRAALSCFVITSIISSFLQKTDALRWTTHLSESLAELANRQECPNDAILVSQVRAQLGVEKACMLQWYDETIETAEVLKTPPTLYVQALHKHLDEARKALPQQSLHRSIALLHLSHSELVISELALNHLLTSTSIANLQRLKFLTACLNSIRAWFETFFTVPVVEYPQFGFMLMSQLVRCLQLLYYLTTFDDSTKIGWHTSEVRASLDVLEVMDRVIGNLTQVDTLINTDKIDGLDFFSSTVQKFTTIRNGWAATLEERSTRTGSVDGSLQLWGSSDDELMGFEDWNAVWLDDGWSMNFGLPSNFGSER